MAKPLSIVEALDQLNERLGKYRNPHTGKPQHLSRSAFHNSVLPLLAKRQDAYRIGNQWVIDPKDWWMWTTYAEGRAKLISDGRWIARRPWSVEDMEAIAMDLIEYD
jgi:hypothetical protein